MKSISSEKAQQMIMNGDATHECCIAGEPRCDLPHIIMLSHESYLVEKNESIPQWLILKLDKESEEVEKVIGSLKNKKDPIS